MSVSVIRDVNNCAFPISPIEVVNFSSKEFKKCLHNGLYKHFLSFLEGKGAV
ncbi:MAG: hypothetical protein AB8G86_02665 [Saprospiraceae bacterium]